MPGTRLKIITGCLLVFSITESHAAVRYSYSGNPYNYATAPFNTTMQISGEIIFDQPLLAGLVAADVTPDHYRFTNGPASIDGQVRSATTNFSLSTGAAGMITDWSILLQENLPDSPAVGDSRYRLTTQPGQDYTALEEVVLTSDILVGISPIAIAGNIGDTGTWTASYIPRVAVMPDHDSENVIDLKRDKTIKVAIYGSAQFDALQINPDSVRFGATGTEAAAIRSRGNDLDHDGFSDLLLIFNTDNTGIACGSIQSRITGILYSGTITSLDASNDIVTVCP